MRPDKAKTVKAIDLKSVTLHFLNGPTSINIVAANDLQNFVEATLRLHHRPGFNPHSGQETARVVKITASNLMHMGPFWWSTPDLQENDDPEGAVIWYWVEETTIWERS